MQQVRHFINNLEQIIKQSVLEQSITIAKGAVSNMEAYNRSVGRIQGMEQTVKFAKELLSKMVTEADDSDLPEMTGDDNG